MAPVGNRTPPLGEVIEEHVDAALERLRVAQPARVESFDAASMRADIQPLLRAPIHLDTGEIEWAQLARISNVPVLMPFAGGRRVRLPVAVGDIVLVVFCDFNLDQWKAGAGQADPLGVVEPSVYGMHGLSGAVAIPGLLSPGGAGTDSIEVQADGTVVVNGGSSRVARSGDPVKVTIPINTFLVAATGGVFNSAPVDVTGTIQDGAPGFKA